MEFINSITGEMLTKVIEATQRLLVYPLDFFSEIGAKVGQMILAQLGELPTRVQLILENMVSGFFSIPKSFADQLFSGGMAKSLEMLPEIITGFVQAIVDIPLFFIKTLVESDHSEIALKVATILPLTGIDAVLSPVNLLLQSITGGVDSKDTGFINIQITHISPNFSYELLSLVISQSNEIMRLRDLEDASNSLSFLTKEIQNTSIIEMRNSISSLLQSQLETKMVANIRQDYILRTIEPPFIPEKKSAPSRLIFVVLTTIIGFSMALLFVFFRDFVFIRTE